MSYGNFPRNASGRTKADWVLTQASPHRVPAPRSTRVVLLALLLSGLWTRDDPLHGERMHLLLHHAATESYSRRCRIQLFVTTTVWRGSRTLCCSALPIPRSG